MFVQMGKVMIVCLNVAWFYLIMKHGFKLTDKLDSLAGPIVVVVIFTSIIAHLFLCHFDEATNATLHCMAIDMELNHGEPQFGPPSFHKKMRKILHEEHGEVDHVQQYAHAQPSKVHSNPNQVY